MDVLRVAILAMAAFLPSICAAQTTAEEARTLPLPALAQKLLGESGSVMIDVDRPRFEGILEPVRFYSRAWATTSHYALCRSEWVTVHFDENGSVETVSSERRYGVERDIYRAPGFWTAEGSQKVCAAAKSTRKYFPAPDDQSAFEIAAYVDAISGHGPFANQEFSFKCNGKCDEGREVLSALKLDDIDEARMINCPETGAKTPACFELVVGDGKLGPFPKKFRIYGGIDMDKIVISAVTVDVSFTLD